MTLPAIHCRRCNTLMDLVATIQPFGTHPGLNAYACTTCGHTDSELIVPLILLWSAIRGREIDWGGFQRSQRDVECAHDPRRREIEIGPALQLIDEAVLDQS